MTDQRSNGGTGSATAGGTSGPASASGASATSPGAVDFTPAEPLEASAGDVAFDSDPALEGTTGSRRKAGETFKAEAGKLGSQAADRARAFAGDGKAKATGALDEFSRMMNDAAGTVDEKLGEQYGQYARSAAQSIGGFADTLRAKEVDDLLEDVRGFVRSSPVIAIGTAAALGFVLARVVKAGIDGAADTPPRS